MQEEPKLPESEASNEQKQSNFKILTQENQILQSYSEHFLWVIVAQNKSKAKAYSELNIFFIFPFETWDYFLQAFGRRVYAGPWLPVKIPILEAIISQHENGSSSMEISSLLLFSCWQLHNLCFLNFEKQDMNCKEKNELNC